jgi:hemoglobin
MNQDASAPQTLSLYERLGGEPGLRGLVDDVVDRIADNPFLEYYFRNIDKGRVKILAYEYLSMRTGGPDLYSGREVHSAFYSLNPRPEEYDYAMADAAFVMDEKQIGQTERTEFISILEALRADVLRAKTL